MEVYYVDEDMLVIRIIEDEGLFVKKKIHSLALKICLSNPHCTEYITDRILEKKDQKEIKTIIDCVAALLVLEKTLRELLAEDGMFDYRMMGIQLIANEVERRIPENQKRKIERMRKKLLKEGIEPYELKRMNSKELIPPCEN